jgi:hypothetical protein
MTLTIQKEVAQRICAKPGDLSLLALSVQVFGNPRVALAIPAGAFYPAPKVDSAVLTVELLEKPLIPQEHLAEFFNLAKAAFSTSARCCITRCPATPAWALKARRACWKRPRSTRSGAPKRSRWRNGAGWRTPACSLKRSKT